MTSDNAPNPEPRCPLCGQPNGCVPARTGRFDQPCWCAQLEFSPQALEGIAADPSRRACLCRACAQKETP